MKLRTVFKSLGTLSVAAALSAAPLTATAKGHDEARGKADARNNIYIVQMVEQPVVAYDGSIDKYKATKLAPGKKLDPLSQDVISYADYLDKRHSVALGKVGGKKVYDFRYSFNGFAAEMTAEQAEAMRSIKGVLHVSKDEARQLDTSSTPAFIGLDAPGGLWEQLGGADSAGEGVVIGIIDGGIWPESLSFSDRTGANGNASKFGKLSYQQLPGWNAKCKPGEAWTASNCNQKIIGAQYYNSGWGGNAGIDAQLPWEYNSPRDFGGHGTHTASTAGGNHNVKVTGPAAPFGKTSGIAPRARISVYKVCWETPTGGGSCFGSDSVAAIDQAVLDGVDVLNYSISGSRTNFLDPVEVAFLYAADAGVFVAASAGNSGPTSATVAHPGPWLTTVAAGTHNRGSEGSATTGDGTTYYGASLANAVSGAFIDSTTAGLPGANANEVALCYPGTLDPAVVSGKIVLCDRGVIARVDKSLAVQMAGGIGSILVNVGAPGSLNADFHSIPTVHLQSTDRAAIKAYAATAGATISIADAAVTYTAAAPFTASFSSRGPLLAGNGDLLKPDLIAPGQDILAAVAPPGNNGRDFDLYSGTSMSSPHVAGLGALMKERHPGWSPMMIKSALMTTGIDVLDGGPPGTSSTNPVLIYRQGAGHVRPTMAADPGLVLNSGWNDWLAFLCGTTTGVGAGTCALLEQFGYSTVPSDLNVASISIGAMPGAQTVTRRVTNVGGSDATYTASVAGLTGFNVVVSPASLDIAAGATETVSVTITRTTATLNSTAGGQLTLSDGSHSVRIPMLVRPVLFAAPSAVSGTGGDINYSVQFGYTGDFTATGSGLQASATTPGNVADDPSNGACSLTAPNAVLIPVTIPAGTTYARFSLFDADVAAGADIDLCVHNSGGTQVGASGTGTSAEEVNLSNPAAGDYTVVVQGWGVVDSSPFVLNTWLLDGSDAGNMSVSAPASATTGVVGDVTLSFSGLDPATRYLGRVAYSGVAGLPAPTSVRVDTP